MKNKVQFALSERDIGKINRYANVVTNANNNLTAKALLLWTLEAIAEVDLTQKFDEHELQFIAELLEDKDDLNQQHPIDGILKAIRTSGRNIPEGLIEKISALPTIDAIALLLNKPCY